MTDSRKTCSHWSETGRAGPDTKRRGTGAVALQANGKANSATTSRAPVDGLKSTCDATNATNNSTATDKSRAVSQQPVQVFWMLDKLLVFGLWSQSASIPTRLVPSGRGPGAAPLTIEQSTAGARSDVGKDKRSSCQQHVPACQMGPFWISVGSAGV